MFEYLLLPLALVLFLAFLALPLIVIYLFVRLTEEAFEQVGFGHWHASMMVFGSIIGSLVDIPLYHGIITSYPSGYLELARFLDLGNMTSFHPVTFSVNLGGCIIPLIISLDLLIRGRASLNKAVLGSLLVAAVTYSAAVPVANEGIVLPVYVPPTVAAIVGLALAKGYKRAPALAYISGSMGTLLGADILNLLTPGVLTALAPPTSGAKPLALSIGGAGIFDGIFLTGILAVLLASLVVCLLQRSSCPARKVMLD